MAQITTKDGFTFELAEQISKRALFGGGSKYRDTSAINRHSVRQYYVPTPDTHDGGFILDKTLDGVPPFYTLSESPTGVGPGQIVVGGGYILIDGKEYWGDGLTWRQAEAKMRDRIKEMFEQEA